MPIGAADQGAKPLIHIEWLANTCTAETFLPLWAGWSDTTGNVEIVPVYGVGNLHSWEGPQ